MNDTANSLQQPVAVICGAEGDTAVLWAELCLHGGVEVAGFVSDDPAAVRRGFCGQRVLRPEDPAVKGADMVLVFEAEHAEWRNRLRGSAPAATCWRTVPGGRGSAACRERLQGLLPAPARPAGTDAGATLRVGVFGTGQGGAKVWEALLVHVDVEIVWFADNDRAKQGTSFLGIPVIAPAAIPRQPCDLVVVASMYAQEICGQLCALGVPEAAVFVPNVAAALPRIAGPLSAELAIRRKEATHG